MKEINDPLYSITHLPPEIDTRLRKLLRVHSYSSDETIFTQGEPPEAIYLIVSGRVKVVRVTPEGYESVLCVREPGEYLCPVPLIDGGDQLGSAIAINNTTLFSIESGEFINLCQESPELLAIVQGDCLAEVRHLMNRLETFAFRSVRGRVAIVLLNEIRAQQTQSGSVDGLRLTQQELAGLVGAARESVSRILKSLERDGLVELHRGRIQVLDLKKLEGLTDRICGGL